MSVLALPPSGDAVLSLLSLGSAAGSTSPPLPSTMHMQGANKIATSPDAHSFVKAQQQQQQIQTASMATATTAGKENIAPSVNGVSVYASASASTAAVVGVKPHAQPRPLVLHCSPRKQHLLLERLQSSSSKSPPSPPAPHSAALAAALAAHSKHQHVHGSSGGSARRFSSSNGSGHSVPPTILKKLSPRRTIRPTHIVEVAQQQQQQQQQQVLDAQALGPVSPIPSLTEVHSSAPTSPAGSFASPSSFHALSSSSSSSSACLMDVTPTAGTASPIVASNNCSAAASLANAFNSPPSRRATPSASSAAEVAQTAEVALTATAIAAFEASARQYVLAQQQQQHQHQQPQHSPSPSASAELSSSSSTAAPPSAPLSAASHGMPAAMPAAVSAVAAASTSASASASTGRTSTVDAAGPTDMFVVEQLLRARSSISIASSSSISISRHVTDSRGLPLPPHPSTSTAQHILNQVAALANNQAHTASLRAAASSLPRSSSASASASASAGSMRGSIRPVMASSSSLRPTVAAVSGGAVATAAAGAAAGAIPVMKSRGGGGGGFTLLRSSSAASGSGRCVGSSSGSRVSVCIKPLDQILIRAHSINEGRARTYYEFP